jgi:thioredoxin-like negative regulator of GroEL
VQDEVRAQLAMMYLRNARVREARALADEMRLDRQPQPKAKAFYAAVMAEAFARTGKPEESKKLLDTYSADDPAFEEVRAMLLRAQVFTFFQLKKRGLATKAIQTLAEVEPGMVAAFTLKGTPPDIIQLARQTLAQAGYAPKMKIKRSP